MQGIAGPAQVGLIMVVGTVPSAVLTLAGGVLSDRFGRHQGIPPAPQCAVSPCWLWRYGWVSTAGMALSSAVSLVFGAVDALFMPAVGALPPSITTTDQLARLQGLRVLMVCVGQTAGSPAGGLAMGLGGTHVAFLVSGLLFAVSLVLLHNLRIVPSLPVAVTAAFAAGAAGGLSGALLLALAQHAMAVAYLGRVTAVLTPRSIGLAPSGFVAVGSAAEAWGTGPV